MKIINLIRLRLRIELNDLSSDYNKAISKV